MHANQPVTARFLALALATALTGPALADQQLGAQIYTKKSFGYGRFVFQLDPSADAGIVNGFFLLKFQNGYPNGWTEIDFEVVTGNTQNFRRTAKGTCGDFASEDGCIQGKLGSGTAANYVSPNIIAGPSSGGPAGDSQVFYQVPSGYFNKVHTYSIENTPNNVRWSLDGLGTGRERILYQDGASRPSPYPSDCTQYCDDVHTSHGFQYLKGREMNIYLNIYSGLGGGWGGPVPTHNTQMVVQKVAFYPLTGCNGNDCTYAADPAMESDFKNNHYVLDGQVVNDWQIIWTNVDSTNYPVYTRAANSSVIPGKGLVMRYVYTR